jgi:hypothetical protein
MINLVRYWRVLIGTGAGLTPCLEKKAGLNPHDTIIAQIIAQASFACAMKNKVSENVLSFVCTKAQDIGL